MFLWELYKPEFWYWEVVETTRRLMMTGVLSTINPGTFSQLVAGQLMNVLYGFLLCQTNQYNDNRDNSIAALSTLRIVVFFIASMLMKGERFHRGGLRLRNHGSFTHRQSSTHHRTVLAWAYYQKDIMSTSVNSMASGALTGWKKKEKGKKKEGKGKVGEDLEVLGFEGSDQVGNPMQGEVGEIEMKGANKKHLLQASGFNALGKNKSGKGATGPRRKNKKKYEEDSDDSEDDVVGPPASQPAVFDLRRGNDSDDDVKPPALPSPALPSDNDEEEDIPPPPPRWKHIWDESAQAYCNQHSDGVTSTWDKPDEFIEIENRVS